MAAHDIVSIPISGSLVDSLPHDVIMTAKVKLRMYRPDLTNFFKLCTNKYRAMINDITNSEVFFFDLESWLMYCYGILICTLHLNNRIYYATVDIPNDSSNKLLNLCIGSQTPVPRWLIDICRELSRPVTWGRNVFVPAVANETKFTGPTRMCEVPMTTLFGIDIITTLNNHFDAEYTKARPLAPEELHVVQVGLIDGKFMFWDDDARRSRRLVIELLMHFRNGTEQGKTIITSNKAQNNFVMNRIPVPANSYVFQTLDTPEMLRGESTDSTGRFVAVMDADWFNEAEENTNNEDFRQPLTWLFDGHIVAPGRSRDAEYSQDEHDAFVLQEQIDNLGIVDGAAEEGKAEELETKKKSLIDDFSSGRHDHPKFPPVDKEFLRFWFYWSPDRSDKYNAWSLNSRNAGAQMPGLVVQTDAVFNLTEYCVRFPVDESHSQTPDGSPRSSPSSGRIPPKTSKKKRRSKKKKGGGSAAAEEEDNSG